MKEEGAAIIVKRRSKVQARIVNNADNTKKVDFGALWNSA